MPARSSEEGARAPVPRCVHTGGSAQTNGTCMEHADAPFFPPFSSTFALIVLAAMIVGIIFLSLATFHFHKRRMRKKKIARAQEEYERDSRSRPACAARKRESTRPCVIVRPAAAPPRESSCTEHRAEEPALTAQPTFHHQRAGCHMEVPGDSPAVNNAEKSDTVEQADGRLESVGSS